MLCILFLLYTVDGNVWILDNNNELIYDLPSLSSNFGPDIDNDVNIGFLYLAKPIEACQNISPPTYNDDIKPLLNIAIIQRSLDIPSCVFDKKIYFAQLANYNAAIVFNDRGDDLLSMQSSGTIPTDAIKIPSVFVGLNSGKLLMDYVRTNISMPFKVQLRRDEFHGVKFYLIPFVCVLILALSLMISILILRCIARYRRERANRLPKSALKHIPVKRYTKADGYDTCVICLDDYVEGVKIRILFCGHVYHCKCIDPWLLYNKRTCPVCKRKVLRHPDDEDDSDSSDENDEESETSPLLLNQISPSTTYTERNHMDDELVILTEDGHASRIGFVRSFCNWNFHSAHTLLGGACRSFLCSVTEPINRVFFVGSIDSNEQLHSFPLHRSDDDNDEEVLLAIENGLSENHNQFQSSSYNDTQPI